MIKSRQMMMKEIVDRLVGPTDVWCETQHDDQAYDNMKELEELVYHLIDKVVDNYKYKDRCEASAQHLAKQAEGILKEIYYMVSDYVDIDQD